MHKQLATASQNSNPGLPITEPVLLPTLCNTAAQGSICSHSNNVRKKKTASDTKTSIYANPLMTCDVITLLCGKKGFYKTERY